MSVRVNLLPEATKQRDRASQQRAIASLAGVVLLAALGATYFWAASQVSQAEDVLAVEQGVSAELRGEEAELSSFRELADRQDAASATITAALSGEVSVAAVLQDLAAVMPADAQLENVAVTLPPMTEAEPQRTVGTISMSGKTLTSHAPGVERMLLQLDKIVTFSDLYLTSSTLDDEEGRVATFALDGQVTREALTQRYTDGLPEVLR